MQIFCEFNHNIDTNMRLTNVMQVTKHWESCLLYDRCIFFMHELCDRDHSIKWHTPYIFVIKITQNFAVWTVERFSARFHCIRTGPGYLCRRTLTINLGPQA